MILTIRIVLGIVLCYYIFKIIFLDLFIAFYNLARKKAIDIIMEKGLDEYIKYEAMENFFRHVFVIFIVGSLFFASINISSEKDLNGKEIKTVSFEKVENIEK